MFKQNLKPISGAHLLHLIKIQLLGLDGTFYNSMGNSV